MTDQGIDLDSLAETVGKPEADLFDLLCHYAYNLPFRTRRERAERLRREESAFLHQFSPDASQMLDTLIEKYAEHGSTQFKLPEVLEVPPCNEWGNVVGLASRFGSGRQLRAAVNDLQRRLYAA